MNDKELLATKIEGNYKSPLKNCSCYNEKLEQSQFKWNSLREYIKNNSIYYNTSDGCQWVDQFKLLDKMNELEGNTNESKNN